MPMETCRTRGRIVPKQTHTLISPTAAAAATHHLDSRPSPQDQPLFTFIEQDDSLSSKQIKDTNARKVIRSHVMRDVRRRERLAGFKRISKREKQRDSTAAIDSNFTQTEGSQLSLSIIQNPNSTGSNQAQKDADSTAIGSRTTFNRPPSWTTRQGSLARIFHNPLSSPDMVNVDPFGTLPGMEDVGHLINNLLKYMDSVLIPMTFPMETKDTREVQKRLAVVMLSAMSEPGAFFAHMALSAAHRAVLHQNHWPLVTVPDGQHAALSDATFYIMKAKTIKELNVKLQDPDPDKSVDDTALDMVVSLVSATLTLGLFEESRVHLKALKKMVDFRGGVLGPKLRESRSIGPILTCDIKAAAGLSIRPLFPLTWEPQPFPTETEKRVFPAPTSKLRDVGSVQCTLPHLSTPLRATFKRICELLFFETFNRQDSNGLTPNEYEMFRIRSHEIEHELLDYPYRSFKSEDDSKPPEPINMTPIETVGRLAAMCFVSYNFTVCPPRSGVGRAITEHMKDAYTRCSPGQGHDIPADCLDLLAWGTFLGAYGSAKRLDRIWFLTELGTIATLRQWNSWDDVEAMLHGYLYTPSLHGQTWKKIWDEVSTLPAVTELEDE